MKALKYAAIVLAAYVTIVIAFECLVIYMGSSDAASVKPREDGFIVITTTDDEGSKDTVIAGVEHEGHLYVAANHWPRGWYKRALERPDVEITHNGSKTQFRAKPVDGAERDGIALAYELPLFIRVLTGFPPRSFLRLDAG